MASMLNAEGAGVAVRTDAASSRRRCSTRRRSRRCSSATSRRSTAGRPSFDPPRRKSMMSLGKGQYHLGNERLSYAQLLGFDQSGHQLHQRLRAHYSQGQGGGIDDELFTQVGDALREQASPPRLRAALYRALEEVPGIRFFGRVHDRLGRPAIGIGRATNPAPAPSGARWSIGSASALGRPTRRECKSGSSRS